MGHKPPTVDQNDSAEASATCGERPTLGSTGGIPPKSSSVYETEGHGSEISGHESTKNARVPVAEDRSSCESR